MQWAHIHPPSEWIQRWTHLLAPRCSLLDVACGGGRHLAWFAGRGHAVTGVDRDIAAAEQSATGAELIRADIEQDPWPLMVDGVQRQFGAVVVTNYLWRPLFPTLLRSLLPGGVLLYETFADGNGTFGRPSRPEFLLQPGELLQLCATLHIVAYETGLREGPDRIVQRIAAIRAPASPVIRIGAAAVSAVT